MTTTHKTGCKFSENMVKIAAIAEASSKHPENLDCYQVNAVHENFKSVDCETNVIPEGTTPVMFFFDKELKGAALWFHFCPYCGNSLLPSLISE